jgi:hypothetical protein
MRLVMFSKDQQSRAGVIDGDDIVDINACDRSLPSTLKGILEVNGLSRVKKIIKSEKHRVPRKRAKLLPPIANPGLLLSVGMNYHAHLKEMKTPVPEKPAAFTCCRPPIPTWSTGKASSPWVIGKAGHRMPAAKALDHVAGDTVLGHMGEGLPYSMWRIDHRNAWVKAPHKHKAKKKIAEYFNANFHLTTSSNFRTQTLIDAMLEIGADRILFSTDWPFENIDHAADWFDAASISEADREKIGRTNARRLFKL